MKHYEPDWIRVQTLIEKQLPQSALAEVRKIYAKAKSDKQEAQQIKCLLYSVDLQDDTRESNQDSAILELEKEIATASETSAAILSSLVADMYWNYYSEHRYEISGRTATVNFRKDQLATWGAEDFYRKITGLYTRSLKNEKLLQQTHPENFDAIIVKGNTRQLRPTVFDLLAFRALSFFENDETDLPRPAAAFEIDQAEAFAPASAFISRKFTTTDSLSLRHEALELYQRILAFHLHDAKPDALIDADTWRIRFVFANSTHPDKDALYGQALQQIMSSYGTHPGTAEAAFLLASWYAEKAGQYKAYGDSTHRLGYVKAKEICDQVLTRTDSSKGWIDCYNLRRELTTRSLQFNLERVNVPGEPLRALITFRNIDQLYFRLIRPDEKIRAALENKYDSAYWKAITGARAIREWNQSLPLPADFQSHHAEIKIDGLPGGEYWLLASSEAGFSMRTSTLGLAIFHVSPISYFNQGKDFFVVDRQSGQPLAGAAVQTWLRKYDYKTSKYITEKTKAYKTDAQGYFAMDVKQEPGSPAQYLFDISYKKDRLFLKNDNDAYYYFNSGPSPNTAGTEDRTYTHLFTDRSIYRPGQTLYFKGITVVDESENRKNVRAGYKTVVQLLDANRQVVDSLPVTTSDYGSFSGKFNLPKAGLTGSFAVMMKSGRGVNYVRVEEYKRPKFSVEYDTVKGNYQVDDTIQVTGRAKAYAGNAVDGATVSYRVVREPRFVYPWLFSRWWTPPSASQEIVHGRLQTGSDGQFIVSFKALPDRSIDPKLDPIFDYTVYADVTDINGETRSAEQRVSVSYKSLLLKIDIADEVSADSLKSLAIRAENLSGHAEPATVQVKISRLRHPDRLIRRRYWERPDQFVISREEYARLFPLDEYDNESDKEAWEKQELVFSGSARLNPGETFPLGEKKFLPGAYRIECSTTDHKGAMVENRATVILSDPQSGRLLIPDYWTASDSDPAEPGQTVDIKIGSSADNLFVVQQRISGNQVASGEGSGAPYRFMRLNNQTDHIVIPVAEEDRGGIILSFGFVKHNRFFSYTSELDVPWTNKELRIEYLSVRDKTLPGSAEKWKIKISGSRADRVAAELLAGMYDASLDQFAPHQWNVPGLWPRRGIQSSWSDRGNFQTVMAEAFEPDVNAEVLYSADDYDELNGRGDEVEKPGSPKIVRFRGGRGKRAGLFQHDMNPDVSYRMAAMPSVGISANNLTFANTFQVSENYQRADTMGFSVGGNLKETVPQNPANPQVRKNFNETAFFFPDLKTDSSGSIEFGFTIPEALTRWKFQALAHTKDLAFGYSSREIVTQKPVMVQPNAPRFLREGDRMELSAKLVNMTDKEVTGQAYLQLFDASTNQPVDGRFHNTIPNQYFTVGAGQSEAIRFPIEVPYHFPGALQWRIVATTAEYSDGEEDALPVLSNRIRVTETLPLNLRQTTGKTYRFEKLLQSAESESLQHQALTVEFTTNPAWYAVQALPYLMEFPYECAEQTWNRYYANSLGMLIANSTPKIKSIFEQWKAADTASLLSALQQREDLKSALLEETPWVLEAKSEAEQKKRLGLLFDLVRMGGELTTAFEKFRQLQSENGGFVWFKGGPDNRYITQYILTGIGHLRKLKGVAAGQEDRLKAIVDKALPYLDRMIRQDYDELVKRKAKLNSYVPDPVQVQYLYLRSFFPENRVAAASAKAYAFFRTRAQKTWTMQNKYTQGMIALLLNRAKDAVTPRAILRSLKETSVTHEELGRYWKDNRNGWWWYEAGVERQALLVEAFAEIEKDAATVDELKTWLLKNKQTNKWESTRATAEACYALLLQGSSWIQEESSVSIRLGPLSLQSASQSAAAGTGYFQAVIPGDAVRPEMGQITISRATANKETSNTAWGAVYWQYFEDMDKITPAATPLKLSKKLFVETHSDRGPVLTPVNEGDAVKVGDKIRVRIELQVDRDMEFVHMKDLRAASLEPTDVLSGYHWQGGLGYYQNTRDVSTNFFFDRVLKGTYVFEYTLFASHTGNFSNGITTIQCMYAPEFSAHSEGLRINVE